MLGFFWVQLFNIYSVIAMSLDSSHSNSCSFSYKLDTWKLLQSDYKINVYYILHSLFFDTPFSLMFYVLPEYLKPAIHSGSMFYNTNLETQSQLDCASPSSVSCFVIYLIPLLSIIDIYLIAINFDMILSLILL